MWCPLPMNRAQPLPWNPLRDPLLLTREHGFLLALVVLWPL